MFAYGAATYESLVEPRTRAITTKTVEHGIYLLRAGEDASPIRLEGLEDQFALSSE